MTNTFLARDVEGGLGLSENANGILLRDVDGKLCFFSGGGGVAFEHIINLYSLHTPSSPTAWSGSFTDYSLWYSLGDDYTTSDTNIALVGDAISEMKLEKNILPVFMSSYSLTYVKVAVELGYDDSLVASTADFLKSYGEDNLEFPGDATNRNVMIQRITTDSEITYNQIRVKITGEGAGQIDGSSYIRFKGRVFNSTTNFSELF